MLTSVGRKIGVALDWTMEGFVGVFVGLFALTAVAGLALGLYVVLAGWL